MRTSVEFPVDTFDASPLAYADGLHANGITPPIYELYAVSHSGRLNFGHYVATCIDPHSGTWYDFDDESASEMRGRFDEAGAYVLFYRLKES